MTKVKYKALTKPIALATVLGMATFGIYKIWHGRQVTPQLSLNENGKQKLPFQILDFSKTITKLFKVVADNNSASTIQAKTLKIDEKYGIVKISPFSPTWLEDYPQILEHIESEHLLHVKGKDENNKGLTWHTEKFNTNMEHSLDPEAKIEGSLRGGFQMKLAYFLIPESKISFYSALGLSSNVTNDIKVEKQAQCFYRFFVHPEAYHHFRNLHDDPKITYVSSEKSEFIGTPTSSYRSWLVRHIQCNSCKELLPKKNSIPFIVKLGVAGSVLGSDRWLSPNEIKRSVQAQIIFDSMPSQHLKKKEGSHLFLFSENLGLILQNVQGYPELDKQSNIKPKESGLLIREFPQEFLEGKCKIFSLAALMSIERIKREHQGIGSSPDNLQSPIRGFPLIFEIMAATIKAGLVQTPKEFIQKYLIHHYLSAIENVVFKEGLTLEPHSQNLCMVLNHNLTPKGFAYRDHGGIWIDIATRGLQNKDTTPFYRIKEDINKLFKTKGAIAKGYIGSYSWFYRYQVVIKILNIVTHMQQNKEFFSAPIGAPYQIGKSGKIPERNLQKYLIQKIETEYPQNIKQIALKTLKWLSLKIEDYNEILKLLDSSYLQLMNKYFYLDKVEIQMENGCFPSAEGGSLKENVLYQHKGFLGKYRYQHISNELTKHLVNEMPPQLLQKVKKRVITSFEDQSFEDTNAIEYMVVNRGLCFLDKKQEIVAFMHFTCEEEKYSIEKILSNQ